MDVMGGKSALILIAAVIVALFAYDYAVTQGWTGSRQL